MVGPSSLAVQCRQRPGLRHDTAVWVAGAESYEGKAQICVEVSIKFQPCVCAEEDRRIET